MTEVQDHVPGPDSDTNVVLAGSVSVNRTLLAGPGPPLATICEKVMFCPAVTGFGLAALVTLRSAWPAEATPMAMVAVLSLMFVSGVAEPAVAVSVMMVPAAVPAFTV